MKCLYHPLTNTNDDVLYKWRKKIDTLDRCFDSLPNVERIMRDIIYANIK